MILFSLAPIHLRTCGFLLASPLAFAAPVVTKLYDFNNTSLSSGQNPYDTPVMVGNELWFTTQNGGSYSRGTLCSFNLGTKALTVRLHMADLPDPLDSTITLFTGDTPQGTPVLHNGTLYYTTTRGGTGDRGTLNAYTVASATHSVLWQSLSNSPANNPNTVTGNVAIIDRGALGKDIYMLTSNGGLASAIGTIQRYNTLTGQTSQVHAFGQTPESRQPFKGFTAVGNKLYFTTFTGGNTSPSGDPTGTANNGLGTLNELDVTTPGAEVYRQLAVLQKGSGASRFPGHNPYYRAADHCLYFTTSGTTTRPGTIQRFDIASGKLGTVYELQGAATSTGSFPEGKQPYGPIAEWNRALYFTTISGGANNGGTISRYSFDTGLLDVVAHMDTSTGDNLGGESRGGLIFNGSTASPAFYLLARQGGSYDHGTILRVDLDAAVPLTSFETWLASHPQISGSATAPTADPDGDGLSNQVEFAFGTSPSNGADSTVSRAVSTPAGLEIRWTASTATTVRYTITGSPTLGDNPSPWTPVDLTSETMSPADIVVPSGYERRRVIVPINAARGFFRVEATFLPGAKP